ncbi:hypothetical protein NEDG_00999 [Nematocida displodere]|uniref:DUF2439 domain-containing protein n=1 Tax=Nematocida displodere TaxID=1805483 RepID=A0A177EBU6_9MICR|nr:hypothetical protein NEDG_00999 [Nematocida displodere]
MLECTYRYKNKKKWLEGFVTVTSARVTLFDTQNTVLDYVGAQKVQVLDDDTFSTAYFVVLPESPSTFHLSLASSHPPPSTTPSTPPPAYYRSNPDLDKSILNAIGPGLSPTHSLPNPTTVPNPTAVPKPGPKPRNKLLDLF